MFISTHNNHNFLISIFYKNDIKSLGCVKVRLVSSFERIKKKKDLNIALWKRWLQVTSKHTRSNLDSSHRDTTKSKNEDKPFYLDSLKIATLKKPRQFTCTIKKNY